MSRLGLLCRALRSFTLESSSLSGTMQLSNDIVPLAGLAMGRESVRHMSSSSSSGSSTPVAATQGISQHQASAIHPWTPTRLLEKRKTLPKRMGHMLIVLEKEKEEEAKAARAFPNFKAGDMLELKLSIPQNKGRETIFKGICIAKRNRGWRTSFTLRNVIGNLGGIERSFPLYSPHIKDLRLLDARKRKKYRRSKLYYLRNLQPKEYRIT